MVKLWLLSFTPSRIEVQVADLKISRRGFIESDYHIEWLREFVVKKLKNKFQSGFFLMVPISTLEDYKAQSWTIRCEEGT